MYDILILEDDEDQRMLITSDLPSGIRYCLAENGLEFEHYLREGEHAQVYFLDDRVPDVRGGRVNSYFIKHCAALLKQQPNAKIFYIGTAPGEAQLKFCRDKNIPCIDKSEIASTAQELLENKVRIKI